MDAVVLYPNIGTPEESADNEGSLHARIANIVSNLIGTTSDDRADNTIMGWLSSPIKSIQNGIVTINHEYYSGTAIISSVNTEKTIVLPTGYKDTEEGAILTLTNSTTVTATRSTYSGTRYYGFVAVEFY